MYYKPDWPEARERIEAWWRGEVIDRAAIAVTAPRARPASGHSYPPPIGPEHAWTDIEYRLETVEAYCASTHFGGEAYPRLNPSLGPGTLALFLGALPRWMPDTVWYDPIISDLPERAASNWDSEGRWWKLCQQLVAEGMLRGQDRYLVVLPDLVENLDTLASLRGTDELLIDLIEKPAVVHDLQQQVVRLYLLYFNRLFEMVEGPARGSGFHIHGGWAPGRMAKVQCDIGVMISPRHFEELALPYFITQCQQLDYVLWHLDGTGNLMHLDRILGLPNLNAVQWVPGAGQPQPGSPRWHPLYRRIREAGKSLELSVEIWEVEPLVRELGPEGLLLLTTSETEEDATELLRQARTWTRA